MTCADLQLAVERALAHPKARVRAVVREPLAYDAFLAGRTLTRIRGEAFLGEVWQSWSLIEKRTDGPRTVSDYLYRNSCREYRAYRSGLLTGPASGLAAASSYASTRPLDGSIILYLEDLAARSPLPWTMPSYVEAARDLGRFAGRWIGRMPTHDWLFTGWIDHHVQRPALAEGRRLIASLLPSTSLDLGGLGVGEAMQLLDGLPREAARLNELPQTLCHHDAVRANFFRRRSDDTIQTVAIDWEMLGPGTIAADLVSLLFSSVRRGDLSADWLAELTPQALAAYTAGLQEAGAMIELSTVRTAFTNGVALRWTLLRDVLAAEAKPACTGFWRGSAPSESPQQAMHHLITLTRYQVDAARTATAGTST